jgi:hypothetical protein
VGHEKVLLQTKTGQYLGINPVGGFIWELLSEPRTAAELTSLVMQRYAVDERVAHADVAAFIQSLSEEGLVEVVHDRH